MLWFIGLGVSGSDSLTSKAIKIIQDANLVYLESFTSPIYKEHEENIRNLVNGDFKIAKRWLVEDGQEIINAAKNSTVVLLSYGDPYIATTHIELRIRAKLENIETKTVHSTSVVTAMIGEVGLQYYKVGRIMTIMRERKSITTPYRIISKNLIDGLHSVILLEYNQDENFFLDPKNAIMSLLDAEKEQKRNILSDKGGTNFTESDAINTLTECVDKPLDNSSRIKSISIQMIEKYVPMVRKALEEIKPLYNDSSEFQEVFQNAEHYVDDAENFLKQGKDENAVLSVGYADGLIDALRIAKGIEPKM